MADKYYAWSRIRNGGETDSVTDPLGRDRKVVLNRNVIEAGSEVKPSDVGGEDTFDDMVEAGVLRPYPFPKDYPMDSNESPVDFLRRRMREAAEANMSEEQQLLMATGQGAILDTEQLVASQPETTKDVKETAGTK
jgi:hypothetical protein